MPITGQMIPLEAERPDWHDYFLSIAKAVSERSTCPRAHVGALLVRDNHILLTGYNGAPAGQPHCIEIGCDIVDDHCQRAIHAEGNVIGLAAKIGIPVAGATIYVYDSKGRLDCCRECWKFLKPAGIARAVVGRERWRINTR